MINLNHIGFIVTDLSLKYHSTSNIILFLLQQDIQLISSMTNGRASKSEESHFKSDKEELVTAIESILWRNDKKKRSQSSLIKTSSTSSGESKIEESKKVEINTSSLPSAPENDSKEKVANSLR